MLMILSLNHSCGFLSAVHVALAERKNINIITDNEDDIRVL